MMPNTSVRPAASRNSSRPNCRPFSDCSMRTSIDPLDSGPNKTAAAHLRRRHFSCWADDLSQTAPGSSPRPRVREIMHRPCQPSLHRAFVVEAILVVLDDGGHRLERELAVSVLDDVLQVEVLDRDMVLAVFERTAHRFEVGLLHFGLHLVLLRRVALH